MVDIEMIDEEEAMRMIRVSSRVTIRKYTERYNFPKPSGPTLNSICALLLWSGS